MSIDSSLETERKQLEGEKQAIDAEDQAIREREADFAQKKIGQDSELARLKVAHSESVQEVSGSYFVVAERELGFLIRQPVEHKFYHGDPHHRFTR